MIFDLRIGKDIWKQMFRMTLLMLALLGSSQASAGYYICQGNGGVGEIAVAYGSPCPFGGMRIYKLSEPVAFHKLSSGGAMDFTPSSEILDFGRVDLNNRSAAQTIKVTNTAEATLAIASTPTASEGFVVDASGTSCSAGTSLAPGESCTVAVYFTPDIQGTVSGQLDINFRYFSSPYEIRLTGAGVSPTPSGPALSLSSASLDFGSIALNSQSSSQTVTLKNTSAATVTLTKGIAISGDFTGSTNCTSGGTGSLKPGASCTITASFKPTDAGTRSGTITIASNDAYSPTYTIKLSGAGVSPTPTPSNCDAQLDSSLNLTVPYLAYGNSRLWAKLVLTSTSNNNLVFKLVDYGSASGTCSNASTLSASLDLTMPALWFQSKSYNIKLTFVPLANGTPTFQSNPASQPQPAPAPASAIDSQLVGTWKLYHIESTLSCAYWCNYVNQTVQFATMTIQSDGSFTFSGGSGFDNGKLSPYSGSSGKWGGIKGLGGSQYYVYYDASSEHPLQMRKVDGNASDDVYGVKK